MKIEKHSTIQPNWRIWPNDLMFVYELGGSQFESSCIHVNFRFRACFNKELFEIQETIECGLTPKYVGDMTRTNSYLIIKLLL